MNYFANPRRKLLHVLPHGKISGLTMFASDLARELRDYQHTLIYQGPTEQVSETWLYTLQANGVNVLSMPYAMEYSTNQYNGVIMYDNDAFSMGDNCIHYCYDSTLKYDRSNGMTIVASQKVNSALGWHVHKIIPPAINSRSFRRIEKAPDRPFSIGIVSSDYDHRYPKRELNYLLKHMPKDMRLIVSQPTFKSIPPKGKSVWQVPVMVEATTKILSLCDVMIYAHSPITTSGYGRAGVEIMASGTPMLCRPEETLSAQLVNGTHAAFYSSLDEMMQLITRLHDDREWGEMLGANAIQWAAWQDITIHVGAFKEALRELGI